MPTGNSQSSVPEPLFDSHLHIIDPQYPLIANNGYIPPPFTCGDYRDQTAGLQVRGGAVVSGSFQAFDQSYLLAALRQLGPGFVGVTQLPADTSDDEILSLDRAGVRAVRFNLFRGGSEGVSALGDFARRVHDLAGWHVELYVASRDLGDLYATLAALPAVSIDHLGLTAEGFDILLRLVDRGVRVKATGFGRVDFDVTTALQRIAAENPDALMFGSDLPSTRAPRPFSSADIRLIRDALDESTASKVLYGNAAAWYRLNG